MYYNLSKEEEKEKKRMLFNQNIVSDIAQKTPRNAQSAEIIKVHREHHMQRHTERHRM